MNNNSASPRVSNRVKHTDQKSQFIRDEFECFVRIGLDPDMRERVQKIIEKHLLGQELAPPCIYLEARNEEGEISEMWFLETDENQLLRLLEFLHRFSIEDVRLIESLLRR